MAEGVEAVEIDPFDKPGEACGVFGIYAPGASVDELTYQGLTALQHRGQEGAGISLSDGQEIGITNGLGLVSVALKDPSGNLASKGRTAGEPFIATGHTRYATAKDPALSKHEKNQRAWASLQPIGYMSNGRISFTLGHNGHVEMLDEAAGLLHVDVQDRPSDSQGMTQLIGEVYDEVGDLPSALEIVLPRLVGAYSLVLATESELIAARDPHGFRPLHIGTYQDKGYVIASETAAFDVIGAEPQREVEPGEIITIGKDYIDTRHLTDKSPELVMAQRALCSFEYVYFSRPDNVINGETVHDVRTRSGIQLAEEDLAAGFTADNLDVFMGVPESGLRASLAYAKRLGVPYEDGIVRNMYVDRSFIADGQDARIQKVRNKINMIRSVIKGKRVGVGDDSIVRGTTGQVITEMLYDAGAAEVHWRIFSPPYAWSCYYGMDTSRRTELLAAFLTDEQTRAYLRANTLRYLSQEGFKKSLGKAAGFVCDACTTGRYITRTPAPVQIRPSRIAAVSV